MVFLFIIPKTQAKGIIAGAKGNPFSPKYCDTVSGVSSQHLKAAARKRACQRSFGALADSVRS